MALLALTACSTLEHVAADPPEPAVWAAAIDARPNPGHDEDAPWAISRADVEFARRMQADPPPGGPGVAGRLIIARTELATGDPEVAASLLTTLVADLDSGAETAAPWIRRRAQRDLATAWLRVGEQMNCILHHGTESCVAPISQAARHAEPRGSLEAMAVLEGILAETPDDLEARWLLNIAAMTVGRWPDGIPDAWLVPPSAFATEGHSPRFRDVAAACGLADRQHAGGLCVEDLNGDGLLDVLTSESTADGSLRLLMNAGGRFVDRTIEAGLGSIQGGRSLLHADADNDGDGDLLVLRDSGQASLPDMLPVSLLIGDGGGSFHDAAAAAGLDETFSMASAALADHDLDGWIDVFVGDEATSYFRRPSRMYRNRGDGTFEEVRDRSSARIVTTVTGCAWGDADGDGDPDLAISRRNGSLILLRNERGRFADVSQGCGINGPMSGRACCWFDADQDGALDLFVAGWKHGSIAAVCSDYLGGRPRNPTPRLFRNKGNGTFEDVTASSGLLRAMPILGSNVGDLDNDGWLDLYVGTGEPDLCALVPDRLFRNDGGSRFLDVTTAAGVGHLQKGSAVAFADLDNDGDQDLVNVLGGLLPVDTFHGACFENPGQPKNWISLRLEGVAANRSAIGARLRLRVKRPDGVTRDLFRVIGTGSGFGSQSLRMDIGLGDAVAIEVLEIAWPGSQELQVIGGLRLGTAWRIRQGEPPIEDSRPIVRLGGGTSDER